MTMPPLVDSPEPLTDAQPAEPFGETYDAWPDVLAVSADGRSRLARSRDEQPATQWLIQRRQANGSWVASLYFQDGPALRMYRREALRREGRADRPERDAFFADPSIGPVIDALPERCPQRDKALVSEAIRAARQRASLSRRAEGPKKPV